MAATALDAQPAPDGFVRLVAATRLHSDPDRVVAVLDRGDRPLGGERLTHPDGRDLRRVAIDLRLRVGGEAAGLTTLGKAAYLDLGRPRRTADGWELEIGWQASTAAPLFPVFAGWLSIGRSELRIDGFYAPPGGVIGRVADRMLLHVAANGTARWLLNEIDRAAAD
ncbi:MAG: hypothetical protein ACRDE6_00580 [Candidatus Limnocylindria bacterium]